MSRARAEAPSGKGASLELEQLGLADVSPGVLAELEVLYAGSYRNSHMYRDLVTDIEARPEVFRLFLVRDHARGSRIVGARVIESMAHPFVDYMGFRPIHGKRFSVAPERRGEGIGRRIVDASKAYVFDELELRVIFGESNEVGALAMHGREGALYLADSVAKHFPRNTRSQALKIFGEFVANRELRELRLPAGEGVQFAYCRDERTANFFRQHGYMAMDELADHTLGGATSSARPT
jgi:GNAT superfamily N-acetyltransferase